MVLRVEYSQYVLEFTRYLELDINYHFNLNVKRNVCVFAKQEKCSKPLKVNTCRELQLSNVVMISAARRTLYGENWLTTI